MISISEKRFIKWNFATIIVTMVVILAGGVVRSTGSGMGCPDWPKCFGQYIPPTDVSQLPADYQQKYVAERLAKNERFAKYLEHMGKMELAQKIRNDKSIAQPEVFNAAKTWTEYVNRLSGATLGICMVLTAIFSFAYRKSAKRVVVLSILNVLIVVYQAWLGSVVVSTNLTQGIVTAHMLLAILLLMLGIYTYHYTKQLHRENSVIMYRIGWLKGFLIITMAINLIQIVLGTEVREHIDGIAKALLFADRASWVGQVGALFSFHRDIALLVMLSNIIVYKMVIDRFSGKAAPLSTARAMIGVLCVQLFSGFLLAYFSLPPYAQAVHILFSMILFSLQYYLYLLVYRTRTYKPNTQ